MQNKVKIIGGKFKGTNLTVENAPGLRPTNIRLRETLFNWLATDIFNSSCLDLFTGSGALAIESLSRGAKHATAIDSLDINIQNLNKIKNKLTIKNLTCIAEDALNFIKTTTETYDIVFLDPPFSTNLLETSLLELEKKHYLGTKLIYIEFRKNKNFVLPNNYKIYKNSTIGESSTILLTKI